MSSSEGRNSSVEINVFLKLFWNLACSHGGGSTKLPILAVWRNDDVLLCCGGGGATRESVVEVGRVRRNFNWGESTKILGLCLEVRCIYIYTRLILSINRGWTIWNDWRVSMDLIYESICHWVKRLRCEKLLLHCTLCELGWLLIAFADKCVFCWNINEFRAAQAYHIMWTYFLETMFFFSNHSGWYLCLPGCVQVKILDHLKKNIQCSK